MDKKYELVESKIAMIKPRSFYSHTLYQVKYLKDIPKYGIKAGQMGGYVNGEHNLDQAGDCCVLNNAMVLADAIVRGNAIIKDHAMVASSASISGNATIQDNAVITDHASVIGDATIAMNATIAGRCWVSDHAVIRGEVELTGDLTVSDNARIEAPSHYYKIDRGEVASNACIRSDYDILVVGPIGSRFAYTTFYKSFDNKIYVKCGCFNGTLKDFEQRVGAVYGRRSIHGDRYREAIESAKRMIVLK